MFIYLWFDADSLIHSLQSLWRLEKKYGFSVGHRDAGENCDIGNNYDGDNDDDDYNEGDNRVDDNDYDNTFSIKDDTNTEEEED